jgi:hypothetical protein
VTDAGWEESAPTAERGFRRSVPSYSGASPGLLKAGSFTANAPSRRADDSWYTQAIHTAVELHWKLAQYSLMKLQTLVQSTIYNIT